MTTVTKHGAVIGTVAYMSPEQLRAKPVDHRSDIFSFGAILYEMLTARRAFRGETEVDTMTAVLREQPPAGNLQDAAIPTAYQDIIRHCVEKEPDNRFQSSKDLAFALQSLSGSGPVQPSAYEPRTRKQSGTAWLLAGIMALALLAVLAARMLQARPPHPVYTRLTFEDGTIYAARFAPDGQSIVYAARGMIAPYACSPRWAIRCSPNPWRWTMPTSSPSPAATNLPWYCTESTTARSKP